MSGIWFTSDTHFSHKRVAEIRGFDSIEAHDEAIVDNWNSVVGKNDHVWHLGDVGMGSLRRIAPSLERLNGTIHLVVGNHDPCSPIHRDGWKHQRAWLAFFETIQAYARRKINGEQVLLSHYPYQGSGDHAPTERYSQYRLPNKGAWLLHGHVHTKVRRIDNEIHVGLDAWDLTPVHTEQVAQVMR